MLTMAVLLVFTVDRLYGHFTFALAAAIVLLLVANAPMLRFNCSRFGKNAFVRGPFVLPWPNRTCTRCGLNLAAPHSQNR